ncbi:MAG TPA: metal ABC transporter ATP-binding protein [Thermomicrobiales bacterium]|nr:metal ABC transporter ATP-binding protein [Thermomicrobiales bacterium]
MSSEPLVRVEHLSVSYGDRVALEDVSLSLGAGEVVSLVGPNGAGKSTLLKTIARLVRPNSGTVEFSDALGADPRRRVVYVPQRDHIDWTLPASVRDLVLMGAYGSASRWRRTSRDTTADAERALDVVGMRQHSATQIGRLSGGQQQRVILARALIRPSSVYLLDEPFSGVDAPTEAIFEEVIEDLRAGGAAVLLATHNLDCARDTSTRVCMLSRKVVALGTPDEALTPLNIAVAYGDISRLHIHGEAAHAHD